MSDPTSLLARLSAGAPHRGMTIRLDFSWLPAGALILWWAATRTLPGALPESTPILYWLLAALVVVGYLISVIVHEISHQATARRFGMAGESTLLYPFGGVRGPSLAVGGAEGDFVIALAGPVFSATLAFGFLVLSEAAPPGGVVRALLVHLWILNAILTAVNLLPAFPLDAGRAARAVLWALRGDFAQATATAARVGGLVGLATVALGILIILGDSSPAVGVAVLLFGFILRTAAVHSHRHLIARSSLVGVPVRRFMDANPITVQRALSITSLAEDFIYKHHLSMLPVVDGDRLLGYVTAQRVRELPRDEWSRQTIGTIILPFSADNTVTPETDAVVALDKMTSTGNTRLMVVEEGRLAGVVALNDLAQSLPQPSVSESVSA